MTVIEPRPDRRAKALERRRVPHASTRRRATWPAQARELTGGDLFDVVIESAGHPAAMAQALTLAGNHGRIVYVGIDVGSTVPAELGLIQAKSLRIRGIVGSAGIWPQAIRFLAPGSWTRPRSSPPATRWRDAAQALKAATPGSGNIKVHIEAARAPVKAAVFRAPGDVRIE